jgi:hypothetical protein
MAWTEGACTPNIKGVDWEGIYNIYLGDMWKGPYSQYYCNRWRGVYIASVKAMGFYIASVTDMDRGSLYNQF